MRFLSSRRRHPAAKVALLLFALFVLGGLYNLVAPAERVSADNGYSQQQVDEGRKLFAVGCASCHGLNGEGQTTETIQGPSLVGVGAAAVDFQVSTGRMPMSRPAEQADVKPNRYTEEEIAALAAYVASLGPGQRSRPRRSTTPRV